MDREKVFAIWFSLLTQITPVSKKDYLIKNTSFEDIYNAEAFNKNLADAENIYLKCCEKGIDLISFYDEFYPPLLKEISNPPPVLYKKGLDIDYRKYPLAGVVGSRLVSDYGKCATEKIARELSQEGIIVVSGMAAGVDGIAHRSVISSGGVTVAVLGCGIDIIYPLENTDIYESLCKRGAILSEYPPGMRPTKTSFPQRNRIISGMSHATVVTEARLNSGSLITARTANTQERKVFAVPQNINSPYGQGTNHILKSFATVITEGTDVAEYLKKNKNTFKKTEPEKRKTAKREKPATLHLSVEERRIIEVLKGGVKHIDTIAEETGYPVQKILAVSSLLEIKGVVYSVMGNSYALKS